MRERTMDEMITHFNQTVSKMSIPQKDRMTLLGMITAIGFKYEQDTRSLRDCRNELCLKCGAYTERHNGACEGCRWKA
jgi:succinate dehydrogenase/fumarate reductase-like Fe-S protein